MRTYNLIQTTPAHLPVIREIHRRAFGYKKEALLTAALLQDPTARPCISLLALHGNTPVGHVLFTKAKFKNNAYAPLMHILAPLAVIPKYQKQGAGGALVREGLRLLREMGSQTAFVLGHKEYYPRHGFLPHAARAGYPAPYPIPDELGEYWMYLPLANKEITPGQIQCAKALDEPEHWRE